MKIILAPDSFKECLTAAQVAQAMALAVQEACPSAQVIRMPLADGGEGTLEVLVGALGGVQQEVTVSDPLGRPVPARLGVAGDTAVIEVAQACGLSLLTPEERRPLEASSRGVGELLMAAYRRGCRHFLIGLGGTATCDGGAGMLAVPGVKALKDITVELLCDVDAPFIGPQGAARVFAPQKGASPEDVEVLEARMMALAARMQAETGVDVRHIPGAGAAGGLGGAFLAYWGARKVSGIGRMLELLRFSETVKGASLIITGEGRSDAQTLQGKVPFGILQHAGKVPVALVSGRIEDRVELEAAGFRPVVEVTPRDMPLSEALQAKTALQNIRTAVKSLF
ncbi:MAG: glycerate kinase [Bacteroidales bacterium]|nr:glycerate kinase [Bacteroidales bacterium]MBQ9194299.1 glycerate kinase [Bacteroidales bacterium]